MRGVGGAFGFAHAAFVGSKSVGEALLRRETWCQSARAMPQQNIVRNKQKRRATKKLAEWRAKQEVQAQKDDSSSKKSAKPAK